LRPGTDVRAYLHLWPVSIPLMSTPKRAFLHTDMVKTPTALSGERFPRIPVDQLRNLCVVA
jgi:hypothetical protein